MKMKVIVLEWWNGSSNEEDYLFVSQKASTKLLEKFAKEANKSEEFECSAFRNLLTSNGIAWREFTYTRIDFN